MPQVVLRHPKLPGQPFVLNLAPGEKVPFSYKERGYQIDTKTTAAEAVEEAAATALAAAEAAAEDDAAAAFEDDPAESDQSGRKRSARSNQQGVSPDSPKE